MEKTVLPANATNNSVTWTVADGTGSATISGSGLLTAVSNGTVTVTATAAFSYLVLVFTFQTFTHQTEHQIFIIHGLRVGDCPANPKSS